MRLVRLELKGFKSFAKETVLHFNEDVIGVVGPNGSGKSNIVDAIRWVLGEQKRGELRLDKMSSVIFNGTKRRKAGNVAQVFLTFANDRGVLRSEFATVTIGRLLYRNGDSEYRLNGVPCRRKDITDLFVDTGIQSNSYAIIALGMVDDILADKDNSRLRMLEQAAGISVYKSRKRETENRLARTREDLDRVEDLLFEIDGQLRDLEKQARRAKKHRELRERYRELTLDYASLAHAELREQGGRVADELERAEAESTRLTAAAEELDARVETTKEGQLGREQQLAERRRQLGTVQAKLRQATNERQLAEQKIEYLGQNRKKLSAQQSRAQAERERVADALATAARQLAEAQETRERFEVDLAEAKQVAEDRQRDAAQLRAGSREQSAQLQAAQQRQLGLDREIAQLEARLESSRHAAAAEARRAEEDARRLTEARASLTEAQALVRKRSEQLVSSEEREAQRMVREELLRDELDALAPQLRDARTQRQLVEHESGLLRRALESLEGSSEATKFLAKRAGWQGCYPLLSELLEVDATAQAAVEAVLADLLTCFVVPTAAEAAEGLRLLAEGKLGRAQVLVAGSGSASAKTAGAAPSHPHATVRPLVDLVTCDAAYRRLVDELLHGVYLVDEDPALGQPHPGQTVVDRAGRQLWSPHLATALGTSGRVALTGRRRKLSELESTLERLSEQTEQLDRERVAKQQELKELRAASDRQSLKALRAALADAQRRLAGAEAQVEAIEAREQERSGGEAEERAKLVRLQEQLDASSARRAPIVAELTKLHARQSERDAEEERAGQTLAHASAAYNQANLTAIQLDNRVAALTREHEYAGQQLAELDGVLTETARALGSDGTEVEALRAQVDELSARIDSGQQVRQLQQRDLEAEEAAYLAEREQLSGWERELRQVQRQSAEAQALVARLRERKQEVAYRTEALTERLRIEFNLELAEALKSERDVTTSLAELEAKTAKLRHRLENYGEVNPLAVEAYDAMAERHGDITQQRADILAAMESLEETIAEIDRTATEKLTEAFEAVREHFIEVFRNLFDAEDKADMVMLDPENPLESKIEIVAKPKGKRPQTISQLSGGEKTLTATAFLFALYLIKPAPFCIFDEVDAPLDDSNVEKFNRIIKRFSGESQFIIVTHNKLTMAAVDTIYGVYMP